MSKEFHFSPSIYHQHLMCQVSPALAYHGGHVVTWQRRLRRKLKQLLGYCPGVPVPLNPQVLWTRTHPLGRIEKLVFTSEPYADVPAYLCLPSEGDPPYPVMICLQGHTTGMHKSIAVDAEDETKPIEVPGDRDFGIGCLRHGVAALCIEQRSFGERRERLQKQVASHGCHDAAMQALMLGRTLAGERVYDVQRAIEYLKTRPEIDPQRLGIMGNSGGGTISLYAAALVPELRLAVPSCAFCTFRDSIMSINHCEDNYIPGLFNYADMSDVMGLFAPRPVVVVAGKRDTIFPFEGVQKAFDELQAIYRAAKAERHCHLVAAEGDHRFYADLAWPKMLPYLFPNESLTGRI
ncbi:MAG: prolyl oligopeptidase family serine peptidase [Candidatus Hydrogenedentes bacterium]|nr:prolyl oligopeptidase family serine peptidase [Candidatus Hydrogenedentota bacterium]